MFEKGKVGMMEQNGDLSSEQIAAVKARKEERDARINQYEKNGGVVEEEAPEKEAPKEERMAA